MSYHDDGGGGRHKMTPERAGKLRTADECRTVMERTRVKDPDIWKATFERFRELVYPPIEDKLAAEIQTAIELYEEVKRQEKGRKTYTATRTRPAIKRDAKGFLSRIVIAKNEQAGFETLLRAGLGHWSFEAIVVRFASDFPAKSVAAAQARLDHHRVGT